MKTTIIETKANRLGRKYRLQQRGKAFDVLWQDAYSWKYRMKAVTEEAARNEFWMLTL